ncbi:Type I secretion system, outer membrane component LapE [hydrothermal vent metagenome]|uniref:Type I secretion system, outer membrane component LapE n=1 Tax=hydrothermal vent metagenome TaxID=652676 RepID=A0A1W1D5Y2_9ZZZZ
MRKIFGVFSFALLLNGSLYANGLTLSRAIEILKANNLEIKIAKYDYKSALADKKVAEGNDAWGKLDLIGDAIASNDAGNVFGFKLTAREATFEDFGALEAQSQQNPNGTPPNQPGKTLNDPDLEGFFRARLKWQMPVYTSGKIKSYVKIAKAMTKMKQLEKDKMISSKIYELRKSYYDMALLVTSEKHLNKVMDNIHKLELMTQNMIDVGYAKKVDLLEVRAKKGNVKRHLMDIKLNKRLLYHYISFLLNQKVTEIEVPKTVVPMPKISTKEILDENIDIKRAEVGLAIRKNMIKVAESDNGVMAGVFAQYDISENTSEPGKDADFNNYGSYTFGGRATINLLDFGITDGKIQKAKVEYLKTKTQLQLAHKGIGLKIAKIKTEIKSYDERMQFLEKELALANAIYHNYEGRYVEKLVSMSDVIVKQTEQIAKILELQQVENKRNERIFALEKLTNGGMR